MLRGRGFFSLFRDFELDGELLALFTSAWLVRRCERSISDDFSLISRCCSHISITFSSVALSPDSPTPQQSGNFVASIAPPRPLRLLGQQLYPAVGPPPPEDLHYRTNGIYVLRDCCLNFLHYSSDLMELTKFFTKDSTKRIAGTIWLPSLAHFHRQSSPGAERLRHWLQSLFVDPEVRALVDVDALSRVRVAFLGFEGAAEPWLGSMPWPRAGLRGLYAAVASLYFFRWACSSLFVIDGFRFQYFEAWKKSFLLKHQSCMISNIGE